MSLSVSSVALRAQGTPLRAIAAELRSVQGVKISHEGVANVLRSRSAS